MYTDAFNVVWETPSRSSADSMPVGNGDIGLNVWVEPDGDLLFLIGKTDAWSENGRLLKLARVRIAIRHNPFIAGSPFRQTLKLAEGQIVVLAGQPPHAIVLRVWVDANRPLVRVEAEGQSPFDLQAKLEVWRTQPRELGEREIDSAYGLIGSPTPVVVYPDTVLTDRKDQVVWYHRNETSRWPENMTLQGLGELTGEIGDPLLGRTFGGLIRGEGLVSENAAALRSSSPQKRFAVSIHLLTRQTPSAAQWLSELETSADAAEAVDLETARAEHRRWWREFWDRSRVVVSGDNHAETVSRAYLLQRFITACGGRGACPIEFNGSIFTAEWNHQNHVCDPDYRRWGAPYWFQNTRLIYWPLLASGDYDLTTPFFAMYRDALPLARRRTEIYFGHRGAFFPETIEFWGTYANANYGWERQGKDVSWVQNTYIRRYWSGGLELIAIMLDAWAHTRDEQLLAETLLPIADAVTEFYDRHYRRDENGKIRFEPAQSLEMWHEAVNPLPEIAGLRFILPQLLQLPEANVTQDQRERWQRMLAELPEVPVRDHEGQTVLAAAQQTTGPAMNIESPQLYAVFPYRLYGVGKPDLELGRRTYFTRDFQERNYGWRQDDIQAACLGLADEARAAIVRRTANKNPNARFDAFWGPNFDWIPDQDHGSVILITLQTMLLQTDGRKIHLLPAWPKHWNVEFKLHAPFNTIVEGTCRNGRLVDLNVSPESRRQDIEIHDPQ